MRTSKVYATSLINTPNGEVGGGPPVYANPWYSALTEMAWRSGNEAVRQAPFSGVVHGLVVRTTTPQPAQGSLVLTLRKDGAATLLMLEIAAGAQAGLFVARLPLCVEYLDHLLSVEIVNNDQNTSASIASLTIEYEA